MGVCNKTRRTNRSVWEIIEIIIATSRKHMAFRTIQDIKQLQGKRVLIRSDFNVDVEKGKILDDERITRALPTYEYLLSRGAVVIALSHLGRPEGRDKKFTLEPVACDLAKRLNYNALFVSDCVGSEVEKVVKNAEAGTLIVLENTRFYKEDQKGNEGFAKKLSRLGEIFVADAFGTAHRADASVAGIAKFLPTYAGLLMNEEVTHIDSFIKNPKRPYTFLIGGAKLETKIDLIHELIRTADHVLVGGALANTFLAVQGYSMGASKIDTECFGQVKDAFKKVSKHKNKLILPVDFRVAPNKDAKTCKVVSYDNIPKNVATFDIGPTTEKLFASYLKKAKTIVFNGALGVFENPTFEKGTKQLYSEIARSKARTLAGGGETIVALDSYKLSKKIDYISTGGGAMLTYIEGAAMPGIRVIPKNRTK